MVKQSLEKERRLRKALFLKHYQNISEKIKRNLNEGQFVLKDLKKKRLNKMMFQNMRFKQDDFRYMIT